MVDKKDDVDFSKQKSYLISVFPKYDYILSALAFFSGGEIDKRDKIVHGVKLS